MDRLIQKIIGRSAPNVKFHIDRTSHRIQNSITHSDLKYFAPTHLLSAFLRGDIRDFERFTSIDIATYDKATKGKFNEHIMWLRNQYILQEIIR